MTGELTLSVMNYPDNQKYSEITFNFQRRSFFKVRGQEIEDTLREADKEQAIEMAIEIIRILSKQ